MKKHFFLVGIISLVSAFLFIYFFLPLFQQTNVFERLNAEERQVPVVSIESIPEDLEVPEIVPQKTSVQMLFVGDIMLDRYVRQKIAQDGFEDVLIDIKDILIDPTIDLSIGNLEGTISEDKPRKLHPDNTMFRFSPDDVKHLLEYGFDIVSLANNHSRDFGRESFDESKIHLDDMGLPYFGNYWNEDPTSISRELNGHKIAWVGYHQLVGQNREVVVAEIQKLKAEGCFVIVFPHWGPEYKLLPSLAQKDDAHVFIDAGADLIVGAHPHVIQPFEMYNGKLIVYSLGNFIFDQVAPNTRDGLMMKVNLDSEDLSFELLPVNIEKAHLSLMEEEEKLKLFERLAKTSEVDDSTREGIRVGTFRIVNNEQRTINNVKSE